MGTLPSNRMAFFFLLMQGFAKEEKNARDTNRGGSEDAQNLRMIFIEISVQERESEGRNPIRQFIEAKCFRAIRFGRK